jgi:hypothetical protein
MTYQYATCMAGGWLLLHVVLITIIKLNFYVLDGHKRVLSFLHMCIIVTHTPDIMGVWVARNAYATPRLELLFRIYGCGVWRWLRNLFLRYYSLVVFHHLWLDVPAGVVSLVWFKPMCALRLGYYIILSAHCWDVSAHCRDEGTMSAESPLFYVANVNLSGSVSMSAKD